MSDREDSCLLVAAGGGQPVGYLLGFRHLTFYANGPVGRALLPRPRLSGVSGLSAQGAERPGNGITRPGRGCEHGQVAEFTVRQAREDDARAMAELFAAVAEERTGIATEPPVDVDERTAQFASAVDQTLVAVAGDEIVGMLNIEASRHGFGEFGMLVRAGWRGRGVGSALVRAAIAWARAHGLHKLCLAVFANNAAAIALYRKCGFTEEGRLVQQYRRANGERWDAIVMGLLL